MPPPLGMSTAIFRTCHLPFELRCCFTYVLLQTESGSELLLNNVETYGQYVVEALTSTTVDVSPDNFEGLRGTQGNIGTHLSAFI